MKKEDAVLVVSFGTSYNDSRKKTIEEIEKTIAGHFSWLRVPPGVYQPGDY